MKIQRPVNLNSLVTQVPVDLANDDHNATSIGRHPGPGAIVFDRSLWFVGEGPPPTPDVLGAKDGDCYLDTDSGDVYRMVT